MVQSNAMVIYPTSNNKYIVEILQGISIVQLILVCLQFNHRQLEMPQRRLLWYSTSPGHLNLDFYRPRIPLIDLFI